jgi:hypothetical protein
MGNPFESRLVRLLTRAYSGERAAALAYRGHWRSLPEGEDRERIKRIEAEEWHHRALVGAMLRSLRARPRPCAELRASVVGRLLGFSCRASGWLLPMYAAGRLESRNVGEYEDAARHAVAAGRPDLVDALLTMAEIEWDHEAYFRSKVLEHPARRIFPVWPAIAPRESIRAPWAGAPHVSRVQDRWAFTSPSHS